jgi:hypothetical protein
MAYSFRPLSGLFCFMFIFSIFGKNRRFVHFSLAGSFKISLPFLFFSDSYFIFGAENQPLGVS